MDQATPIEYVILCGLFPGQRSDGEVRLAMQELQALAESAGYHPTHSFAQKRDVADRRYLLGKGKIDEIKQEACRSGVTRIIFHNSLNNMQQRNLETFFRMDVIDRTRLILDIFAARARSMEGKLQVELARLLYALPRLTGKGVGMSRLGGGIGTRGPGEMKLEADRRVIRKRIAQIKEKLEKVIKDRDTQRRHRAARPVPVVTLVGYTSAGKSTLFHALTGEAVQISAQLFSTLDPLLRRVDLHEISPGYFFLLADTVGFIRDMPAELFTSFRATLEEVVQSDIVVHVIDISSPDSRSQRHEVEKILRQMKVPDEAVITVFNKCDLLPETPADGENEAELHISARDGAGLAELKRRIFQRYFHDFARHHIVLPEGMNPDSVDRWAIVLERFHRDGHWHLDVLCRRDTMRTFHEKYGGEAP